MSHIGTIPKLGYSVYQVKYRFVFLKTFYDILQDPSNSMPGPKLQIFLWKMFMRFNPTGKGKPPYWGECGLLN